MKPARRPRAGTADAHIAYLKRADVQRAVAVIRTASASRPLAASMPNDAILRPALDQPRRPLAIFVVIFLGVVAAVVAYGLGEQADNNRIQASFERIAGERIAGVEAGLLTTIASLQPLAAFFVSLNEPNAEKFRRFATPLLASHPEVQGFGWTPAVARAERDLAFPTEMIEPLRDNETLIGFDIGADPAGHAAIAAAIASRAPRLVGRIALPPEAGQQQGWLVVQPAFDAADRLRGLAVGVFRFDALFDRLGRPTADLSLAITDIGPDAQGGRLYPLTPAPPRPRGGAIATARTLVIAGRPWRFEAVAAPEFVERERGHLGPTLLIVWLFLAGNIVWLVDRRFAVEAEVRARTEEMRQARDEARAAARVKSDFLAAMSHEIRTPLNGVVALADHMLEQDPTPHQRDALAIIARSGEHLQRMINDILDFSKLDAKKFTLEPRPFSPANTARNAVALMARQAADKGLSLDLRIDGDFPERVEGDPARLRQILLNLISNAIKFTQTGGVVVEVSAAAREKAADGRRQLSFAIRDTGPGIAADMREKLFTEFWQADTSIARRFGGTGLGLAISRRLARLMGGDITVRSAPGAGSVFTLRAPFPELPAVAAEEIAPPENLPAPVRFTPPPSSPEAEAAHDFTGRAILLAEDNPTNRAIAQTILARTGARIVEACDGVEAVAAAAGEKFDLVLMDVHMPNMTGLEAARAIRQLPAPLCDTPIVALTASAFQDDRDQCRDAGMNDFLAKPYRGGPLRDIAARAMGAAPARPAPTAQKTPDAPQPAFAQEPFAQNSFALLGAEIGAEDARALLRAFMKDAAARLEILEAELRKGELRVPGQQAHALKSSAATMGLARLAAIARELEEAARRDNAAEARTLGQAARAALEEARPQIDQILSAA